MFEVWGGNRINKRPRNQTEKPGRGTEGGRHKREAERDVQEMRLSAGSRKTQTGEVHPGAGVMVQRAGLPLVREHPIWALVLVSAAPLPVQSLFTA